MDYTKICQQLRAMGSTFGIILPNQAADAIEELQKDLEREMEYKNYWQEEALKATARIAEN